MVRTKADAGSSSGATRKVVAARAPRKALGSSTSGSSYNDSTDSPGKGKFAGGNPVCSRPTPEWQKGIGNFFVKPGEKENITPDNEDSSQESGSASSSAGSSSADVDD